MNKTLTRSFLGSFVSARAKMSTKPSSPSHYETLEINSRATQAEIKSAYFKLSKQYHPDKNSSVEAIGKFRNVVDAYEVLGNYDTRRIYDRSRLTKTRYQERQPSSGNADPNIKYYQSQAALYRDAQKSGSTPLYDFDAWTKAHYGRTLDRTLRDRAESRQKREDRMEDNGSTNDLGTDTSMIGIALMFMTAMLLLSIPVSSYDESDYLWTREKNEKEESNFLQTESKLSDVAAEESVSSRLD